MNINKIAEIISQKGYETQVKLITKGSISKMGIVIGTGTVRPTIYPEQFALNDFTDEEIADKVIEIYEANKTPNFDISNITDADYIKNNMFIEIRRPVEDEAFTTSYLDMQLVLRAKVSDQSGSIASYKINKDLAEKIGLDENVFDEAIKNMEFNFKPMGAVIGNMLDDEEIPDCGMYIVSNTEKLYGASVLYDHIYLKSIADMLNSDLVIIPSSIHEILIVKHDENTRNLDDLNAMVREVNATSVDISEQLSDHVYIFEKETGILSCN